MAAFGIADAAPTPSVTIYPFPIVAPPTGSLSWPLPKLWAENYSRTWPSLRRHANAETSKWSREEG